MKMSIPGHAKLNLPRLAFLQQEHIKPIYKPLYVLNPSKIYCKYTPSSDVTEIIELARFSLVREIDLLKTSIWKWKDPLNVKFSISDYLIDPKYSVWFSGLDWMLWGISKIDVIRILQIVVCDIEDRLDFVKTFNLKDGLVLQPQIGVDSILHAVKGIQILLKGLHAMGAEATQPTSYVSSSLDFIRLLFDVLALYNHGLDTTRLLSLMLSVYAAVSRANEWLQQSFDSLSLSMLTMVLPKPLFEIIKRMQIFSSGKLLDDSSMLSDLFNGIIEFVKACVSYLPTRISESLNKLLDLLPFGGQYTLLSKMEKLIFQRSKDKKAVMCPVFREQVKDLYDFSLSASLLEWSRRSIRVKKALEDFVRLYKSILCYENTRRVEPCCFVFEGPPGVFKSVVMNQIIQAMKRPAYSHIVKATSDGKDHYDMYDNEDIFYTDDMGQQGVSQFRNVINWVSEVKFPLECANVELKDTKFFNSPLIFFTTNRFTTLQNLTKDDMISELSALWRRGYVFNFSGVVRDDTELTGTMRFQFFDVKQGLWITGFPPNINMGRKKPVLKLDGDRVTYIRWMKQIIEILERSRKDNYSRNELSEEEIRRIEEPDEDFETDDTLLNDIYQDTVDYTPTFVEQSFLSFDKISETATSLYTSMKDQFELAKEIIDSWLENLWDFVSFDKVSCMTSICVILSLAALVYGGSQLLNINKPLPLELEPQKHFAEVIQECLKHQTTDTPKSTQIDAMRRAVRFCLLHKDTETTRGVVVVSGHSVILPYHCGAGVKAITLYADPINNQLLWDKMVVTEVWSSIKEDVMIMQTPTNIATVLKNVSSFFSEERKGRFLVTPVSVIDVGSIALPNSDFNYSVLTNKRHVEGKDAIIYGASVSGLCGSVVCDPEKGMIGMHVAGLGSTGAASLWSLSTIKQMRRILKQDNKYILNEELSEFGKPDVSGVKIASSMIASVPNKSKLVPTSAHGIFPISRAPANLSAFGRDTVKKMALKSLQEVSYMPSVELNFGESFLRTIIEPFEPIPMNVVIGGDSELASLNKKSSNGYNMQKGKEVYVDYSSNTLTPLGQLEYDRVWNSIVAGQVEAKDIVWVECLKDELRATEKVDKPRTFRCSTVIIQLITKRLFGNLVRNIMNAKWRNGIMVGINPLKDFEEVFRRVSKHTNKWGADFKVWDGKMPGQAQHSAASVLVDRIIGEENKIVASFILHNMPHSFVIVLNDVWSLTHSFPSGSFLTAILNSIVNRFLSACCYANFCQTTSRKLSLIEFSTKMTDFVYGDDKLVGSSIEGFDMLFMAKYFTDLGIGFTTSDKREVTEATESWSDITFLKRMFVFDARFSRILCPLDQSTILSSMSWYDVSKDHDVVLDGKLDAFQREAFLHPEYLDLMHTLVIQLQERNIKHDFRNEDELSHLIIENDSQYCAGFSTDVY